MKLSILFLSFLICVSSYCQNTTDLKIHRDLKPIFYGQNTLQFGKKLGMKFGLNANIFRNIYAGAQISYTTEKAKNVPEKFQKELPYDKYFKAGIQIGQLFHTESKNVKFMVSVTPYYGKKTYVDDLKSTFHPGSSGFNFGTGFFFFDLFTQAVTSYGSYYSFEYNVKSIQYLGCDLRPELLINFNRGFGCSLGASLDYSSLRTNLSGEIGLIYGALSY